MFKNLIRNRSAEKDIRDWLSSQGMCGRTADSYEVELHAIQRPGWLQIFQFEVKALTSNKESLHLFGAMRSDERYGKPAIIASVSIEERDDQLNDWSRNLISKKKK